MTMDMTKEQMIEHHKVSMEKMTRLCMVSAKDATECHAEMLKAQAAKGMCYSDTEARDTINYWKSKFEIMKDQFDKLKEENDTRGGIVDGLVKTIEELKEECGQQEASAEDNEYDLQSLQNDLTSLDEFREEENIVEYDGVVTYVDKLKAFKSEVIDAMKCDDDLDDDDIINSISGMEEDIVGECELQEQIEELKDEIQELKEKYEGELITQEEFVKRSQASE